MVKLVNRFVFIALFILTLFVSIGIFFSRSIFLLTAYLLICLLSVVITFYFRKKLFEHHIVMRIFFVMSFAFIIRALAAYFLNLTPQGDYSGYLSTAHNVYHNTLGNKLYFGIFPHALNYPIFLSFFYKTLGENTWVPRLINLLFGTLESGLAAFVMEKATNPKIGIISGLAVAFNPSIIIFTSLSGAEPIYASLIMCSLFFLTLGIPSSKRSYIFLALAGALSAVSSFFRPTGIILIIAVVIVTFVSPKYNFKVKFFKILTLVISFMIFTSIIGNITGSVSGYHKPSYSFGWNLFIGANESSTGKWNTEDSELFTKISDEYKDPSEIQKYFAALGAERYKEMGPKVFGHFYRKLSFWTEEKFITNAVTHWQTSYTRFKSTDLQQAYDLIINSYNFLVMLGAVIAILYVSLKADTAGMIKILSLYMMGSMMMFMVLETASRYKGAYYSELTILAVYGFWKFIQSVNSHCRAQQKRGFMLFQQ